MSALSGAVRAVLCDVNGVLFNTGQGDGQLIAGSVRAVQR